MGGGRETIIQFVVYSLIAELIAARAFQDVLLAKNVHIGGRGWGQAPENF